MITQIKGKLVEKSPTHAVIDCNGVGYLLHISLHTYSNLPADENVLLYTHLAIREDAHTLYGFFNKVEREIFRLLTSVSGVGPSIARTMLSSMTSEEIQQAIASENVKAIQSVKGIGIKTAQRVIVDLKDKIVKIFDLDEVSIVQNNTSKEEALSALEVLGFLRKQAEKVIGNILKETPDASVETLIRQALKNL
ncbi:Holliday junction branch migration protein RuvA [Tenacibaculum finnmarkense genomovar finnmarkense]|uniref:Holliday junction branch migration complex subunit RuvA n=1 Tax=Tenacibaculum finnmarkense genomovar finnmarkense TaxID=1458503 RepID=A0AAP1RGK0_9FLAO|nr:Holliday junction branch migration protein RuvA [Tenacibaculum finnmarkense]MBE7647471.1 Holliday junction branch migration protein RuvA [Tenacibaculum finnmarkense genomovar ulcerans]MBE7653622.1 Holliday junction branch migration protein RuvA [Tenacibaculum finnmarkense genomovar finnmarkense]MBE7660204.1 Holliday junction branch migration protein RuvA [Tenacibaculum finnmarkense genomovar finnmarkense]MBE7687252.1 Holliday junction branch migration protein RuvA [Tenacibaculum finnmarkense